MPTNEEYIKSLEKDKREIRLASEKNKRWYQKVIKIMAIVCGILTLELILSLANGKEGVMSGFAFLTKIFGGE